MNIIELAREAGITQAVSRDPTLGTFALLERFAALVRAAALEEVTPQPAKQPLTDEEILAANYPDGEENGPTIAAPNFELICFARQIETAHGITGETK